MPPNQMDTTQVTRDGLFESMTLTRHRDDVLKAAAPDGAVLVTLSMPGGPRDFTTDELRLISRRLADLADLQDYELEIDAE